MVDKVVPKVFSFKSSLIDVLGQGHGQNLFSFMMSHMCSISDK